MAEEKFPDFPLMRRRLEELFGYSPGSFDPVENIRQDMERIDRTARQSFRFIRESFDPDKFLSRISDSLNGLPKIQFPGKEFWRD